MLEAIFGLIGVVVGSVLVLGYNYWRDRQEREEKYRLMLYEKRLEAHQKAFSYVQPLSLRLTTSYFSYAFDMDDKVDFDRESNDKEIKRLLLELSNFYDSTCLYLDEQSRNEMRLAISRMRTCLEEPDSRLMKNAIDQLLKAKEAIVSGIGMKHIEEPKKEQMEGKS